jgi:parallel beta-helix repeat protein
MNTRIYTLTAIAACIGLLLTVFPVDASQLKTDVTLSFRGIIEQTPTERYNYSISVSGSNYQMKNGTSEQIVFQSINSSQVFSNVVGNCSTGDCIEVKSGVYTVNTMWCIPISYNFIKVNFENGAKLVAGDNLNTAVLFVQGNNIVVNGVIIDGNAAKNNALEGSWNNIYMPTCGIYLAGSFDVINNATIYNCRQLGVEILSSSGPSNENGLANSGVTNCKIFNCGWNGITTHNVNTYLVNNEIYGCGDVGATSYGVGTIMTGNYIHDMNGTSGANNAQWGIGVEGGGNNTITGNTIVNCNTGIAITNSGNSVLGSCDSNTISLNNISSTYLSGMYLFSSNNIIKNNQITQWDDASIYKSAICINGNGNQIIENTLTSTFIYVFGINIETGNENLIIANVINSPSTAGHLGIMVNSNCFRNIVEQNRLIGFKNVGVLVSSGAISTIIENNNLTLCTGTKINNLGTTTVIRANLGYNPVGFISNPISSSTAYLVDSGSNSTWVSGKVYTNTESSKVLNIFNGTVLSVAQNGVTIFIITNCTVTLQPYDTFSVTFSAVPTINVIGQ